MPLPYRPPGKSVFNSDRLSAKSDFAPAGRDVVDSPGYGLASESWVVLNNPRRLGRLRPLERIGGEFPRETGVNLSLVAFIGTRQQGAYQCIPDVNFSCMDHARQHRSEAIRKVHF